MKSEVTECGARSSRVTDEAKMTGQRQEQAKSYLEAQNPAINQPGRLNEVTLMQKSNTPEEEQEDATQDHGAGLNGLAVTAHELKAPLVLLRQLALSLEFAKDRDEVARIQARMVSVSDRALRQMQDLTRVARLEEGLFEMGPVAVRAVCDEVVEELEQLFHFHRRSLEVRYSNRRRLVVANKELLFSVIYNFCLNALHYSTAETQSVLSIRDKGADVLVNIRDYGPALPRKIWRDLKMGTLVTPTAVAMRPGSSGLGLYIATKFAGYMRAEVGATRHRDGTSFFVRLPVSGQMSLF